MIEPGTTEVFTLVEGLAGRHSHDCQHKRVYEFGACPSGTPEGSHGAGMQE